MYIRDGIKVSDFIRLLEPYSDMNITFGREDFKIDLFLARGCNLQTKDTVKRLESFELELFI